MESTAKSMPCRSLNSFEALLDIPRRYEYIAELGSGGMGRVFKVHDQVLNKTVAIKLLHCNPLKFEEHAVRFQREAKAAAALHHQNIVSVYDFGFSESNRPYMVLEYVEGETLKELIARRGPLSEEQAIPIFADICRAIAHAHKSGVIHRDLKTSNVLISKTTADTASGDRGTESVAKLFDFGIARVNDPGKPMHLTRQNAVLGTPLYMSPEQASGLDVDARSDIYSLGCVMFEVLTGQTPFASDDQAALIDMHIRSAPPAVSQLADIEPMLESIIGKCLQKRSADRYQSADQLLAELESIEAAPDNRPIDWSPPLPEADKLLRDLFQNVSRSERYYARARKSTPSVLIPCALLILSWAGLTAYQQYNLLTNDEKTYAKTKIRLDATDSQAIKKNAITHYIVEDTYEKILDLRNATSDSFDEGTIDDVKDAGVSRIILSQTHMDDGFLMHLSGMSSLRALNVDDTNVTAYGIASLAALPHLEDLALGATKIDREYLKALATIKSLKIIRFFHCDRIDGEGLAELARLPQLRTIQMKDCRISSNLSALSSPSLVELKLYYCSFERNQAAAHTKAGLKHFGAMPNLRQLTLDACDISRSELIEFKAAHRQVQIEVLPPDGPPTGRDILQD